MDKMDIPLIVDDVKHYKGFHMTRLSYFTIESDVPLPEWTLELGDAKIPFLMLGLSGIVVGPIHGDRFTDPDSIDSLFRAVEEDERFYVDLNDIWLPNGCFTNTSPERGQVFRTGLSLFSLALAYRETMEDADRFTGQTMDYCKELEYSEPETRAFEAWHQDQIRDAFENCKNYGEDIKLQWKDDPLFK
jgi:hypothetical protein